MTRLRHSEPGWTLVLPVKGGRHAKSRLGRLAPLSAAIALDTIEAVVGCAAVAQTLVVTSDDALAGQAIARGACVRPEQSPGGGLNAAVADGLAGLQGPVGVLLADLPALRPEDLEAALAAVTLALTVGDGQADVAGWAVVPDADGTGTVLLAGAAADLLRPAFGPGSAEAHVARGAVRLDLDLPRMRRDVDTPADLDLAAALGLGSNVTSALAAPRAAVRLP